MPSEMILFDIQNRMTEYDKIRSILTSIISKLVSILNLSLSLFLFLVQDEHRVFITERSSFS